MISVWDNWLLLISLKVSELNVLTTYISPNSLFFQLDFLIHKVPHASNSKPMRKTDVFWIIYTYLCKFCIIGFTVSVFNGMEIFKTFGCSLKRSRKFQPEDRMFSLSSVTSPAVSILNFKSSVMVALPVFIFHCCNLLS